MNKSLCPVSVRQNEFSFPTDVFENSQGYESFFKLFAILAGSSEQSSTRHLNIVMLVRHPPPRAFRATFSFRNFDTDNFLGALVYIQNSFEITLPKRSSNSPRRSIRFNSLADYLTLFTISASRRHACLLPINVYRSTHPNAKLRICDKLLLLLIYSPFVIHIRCNVTLIFFSKTSKTSQFDNTQCFDCARNYTDLIVKITCIFFANKIF